MLKSFFASRSKPKLYLVSDGAEWILDEVASQLASHLSDHLSTVFDVNAKWRESRNALVHFIERSWAWSGDSLFKTPVSNQYIGLWWHGKPDSKELGILKALENVAKLHPHFSRIQTPTSIAEQTMLQIGVPREKIILLSQGIDCKRFRLPESADARLSVREELGIPKDAFVIGCFQKDGNGWDSGEKPKLIKGPDILAEAMKILNDKRPVFLLIPGPARGYLESKLTNDGVTFLNPGHVRHKTGLHKLYYALDLYVSPSRDEGGPAGVMEAMASGVPVVATKAGVAVDIFGDRENGVLVDLEDPTALAEACYELAENDQLRQQIAQRGHDRIQGFDWQILANEYYTQLYSPLLI